MQPHVLCIEDDEVLARMYARAFETEGMPFVHMPGGEEALEYLGKGEYPTIILLDISLEGMDGFEVLKRLKEDPRTKDIPVIIMSNYSREEDIEWGKKLGARRFVNKSAVVPNEIIDIVKEEFKTK